MLALLGAVEAGHRVDDARAASGWWRRCRGRPAACRVPAAPGSGSPRRSRVDSAGARAWQFAAHGRQRPPSRSSTRRSSSGANRLERHLVHHLGGKGVGEQALGRGRGKAAAPRIERAHVVQPAHRGAVGALHVVGEDLQLRLGVHPRPVAQQQVAVGLLGVGLLRLGRHEDLAVEHRRATGRRGCPCTPPSSGSWAGRGRWRCGCRPAGRPG